MVEQVSPFGLAALLPLSPPSNLIASGVTTPDGTGNYVYSGEYHDYALYHNEAKNLWLFFGEEIGTWIVSDELVNLHHGWTRVNASPVGAYNPFGGYTGILTMAEA